MASAPLRAFNRLRPAFALALLLVVAACGARPPAIVHGDTDPHPGVARARSLPIQGVDIARYQGRVDFAELRAGGMHFAYIKATEGQDYIDPAFFDNWHRARVAGIARGAYHFMTWCSRAADQAAWFVSLVPRDADALPPVLDLEWNNHSSCTNRHDKAEVLEKVRVMLAAMEAHTGKLPIIYTDINFHRDILAGEHLPNTFWLRSTAAEPRARYGNRDFTFWQWTQTGRVRGIDGDVDRNAFYGSEADWVTFLLTGCDPRIVASLGPGGRCRSHK